MPMGKSRYPEGKKTKMPMGKSRYPEGKKNKKPRDRKNKKPRGRKKTKKPRKQMPAGAASTKRFMKKEFFSLVFRNQRKRVKPPESCLELLENGESAIFYMILAFLPSMYILALASTSRKMFEKIFLDKDALNHEFAQRLYIEMWLTILSRNVGYTLDEYCFFHDPENDFDSIAKRLTYEQRCWHVLNQQLRRMSDGQNVLQLIREMFPPICNDEEVIKAEIEHDCMEAYCDCGIVPDVSRDTIKSKSFLSEPYDEKKIEALRKIRQHGQCPCCLKALEERTNFDHDPNELSCKLCGRQSYEGFYPMWCCKDCDARGGGITYCDDCWKVLDLTIPDNIIIVTLNGPICSRYEPIEEKVRRSFDFLNVKFIGDGIIDAFREQQNLMVLCNGVKRFNVRNRWYRLRDEILDYIEYRRSESNASFEDFLTLRTTLRMCTPVPYDDVAKPSKETDRKKPTLWNFIEPLLPSIEFCAATSRASPFDYVWNRRAQRIF